MTTLPPFDIVAEAGGLACVLSADPQDAIIYFDQLAIEDFYDERHQEIFNALSELRKAGRPLDAASLYAKLRDSGKPGVVDFGYCQSLPDQTPSPSMFPSWFSTLLEYRARREALAESNKLREQALAGLIPDRVETDDQLLTRLAGLPLLEYEKRREAGAERIGCRTSILDKLVDARRPDSGVGSDLQGRTLDLADVEPWPDAVNGADVLSELSETFSRYVALPDGAADALVLWTAHAHCFDCFQCSPRLNVSSPDKQCGKTTLLDVLAVLVPRALPAENLSVAVLFRVIEKHRPTLLADETDAWLKDNEELRGLLNAGHRRGGQALRCEGENNDVRAFNVFGPSVLCGIGALPPTLHDRSIIIKLSRARPGEVRQRFDRRVVSETTLCRKLARWCADNRPKIGACDPRLPAGAFNRLADNWRPLFAIAEIAGGDWPERAENAFTKLTSTDDVDAQGLGVLLLADIRLAFSEGHAERLFSKSLVESLCAMSDRPWPEVNRGRSISENWLARRLHSFGVHPKTLRLGDDRKKGYEITDFSEAFVRYLPAQGESNRDTVTTPENTGESSLNTTVTSQSHVTVMDADKSHANIDLSRCHGSKPLTPELVEADLL